MMKQIVVIIKADHFFSYMQNFILHPSIKVNSIYRKLLGIVSVDFEGKKEPPFNY